MDILREISLKAKKVVRDSCFILIKIDTVVIGLVISNMEMVHISNIQIRCDLEEFGLMVYFLKGNGYYLIIRLIKESS